MHTHRRSQHCEVEKKRRERMNRYMAELAQMIPACNAVPRKLDKLSILKMAVDHMKNLQGDCQAPSEYKPGFLTDEELKKLIVEVKQICLQDSTHLVGMYMYVYWYVLFTDTLHTTYAHICSHTYTCTHTTGCKWFYVDRRVLSG